MLFCLIRTATSPLFREGEAVLSCSVFVCLFFVAFEGETKKRYADFGYKNYDSLRRAINRMIESGKIIKENDMLMPKK
jgi:hypothetical protein